MNKIRLVILLIFGYFTSSRCADDRDEINSSLSSKIFMDNVTSLAFTDSRSVRLRDGRTIKELNCVENCKVPVDAVTCTRQSGSLIWRCVSPALQRSSYAFNGTFIVCDYFERPENETSDRQIAETSCYMHYSLKLRNAEEFDFGVFLVILVCFVTIALIIESLKRLLGCQTPIVISPKECSVRIGKRIGKRKPDMPLRTAFSSVPPAMLTNVLTQDLNLDRKHSKSSISDNYI